MKSFVRFVLALVMISATHAMAAVLPLVRRLQAGT